MGAVNIGVAAKEDFTKNYTDNFLVGLLLSKYTGGQPEFNNRPGPTLTTIAKDGKSIELTAPLPILWDDLYMTWNLAYTSAFEQFPYFFAKLLIPSVSGYHSKPEDFIINEANALNTFLNFWVNAKDGLEDMDWSDESFTKNWGSINRKSADDYFQRLADALEMTPEDIMNKAAPDFEERIKSFLCAGTTSTSFCIDDEKDGIEKVSAGFVGSKPPNCFLSLWFSFTIMIIIIFVDKNMNHALCI